MRNIYYYILILALYGDLLKRVLSPQLSLAVLYSLAAIILVLILAKKPVLKPTQNIEGNVFFVSTSILISLYLLQLFTTVSTPFMESMSHAMYMCIPLLYIVVIQKYCTQFDLIAFGKLFLLFMIPINLIGGIQYFVNPNFFISSTYSGELGGVILRNYLEEGHFSRYPSLFASADRYSGMGLMQFYFTFVVFKGSNTETGKKKLWLLFNLISAIAAMFIAGARSRIIIALVAFAIMLVSIAIGLLQSGRTGRSVRTARKYILIFIIATFAIWIVLQTSMTNPNQSFPVVELLVQSIERGDIEKRVGEAVSNSLLPDKISFFGQGLGSIGDGKPGEFGIKSMWIESGFIWGIFMLLAFLGMIIPMTLSAVKAFGAIDVVKGTIFVIPSLLLVFGLLAGLTSAFELSTGLLLCCSLAVISRSSNALMGHNQLRMIKRKHLYGPKVNISTPDR